MASQNAIQRDSRTTVSNFRAVKDISGGGGSPRVFTIQLTGLNAAALTVAITVLKQENNMVTFSFPDLTSTGNINAANIGWAAGGFPVDLRPSTTRRALTSITNNAVSQPASINLLPDGSGSIVPVAASQNWITTAPGLVNTFIMTYPMTP